MRAVFGMLLIMLGLAMAVLWMPERNAERQLAIVTDIATKGSVPARDPSTFSTDGHPSRSFSPQTPLMATVEPPGERVRQFANVARIAQGQSDGSPSSVVVRSQSQTAAVVTGALPAAPIAPAHTGLKPTQPGAGPATSPMKRDELVRSIQRELKRVGCYGGNIDGAWRISSRRAMASFNDRVNATLPTDQPDFIHLTLLRGHAGTACGKGCPDGQSMSDAGRCQPHLITAQALPRAGEQRGSPRDPYRAEAAARAGGQLHAWTTGVQRESIPGAPHPAPVTAARTAPVFGSSSPVQPSSSIIAGSTVAATVAPLPGRMAIGGPAAGSAYLIQPDANLARDAVRAGEEADTARRAAPSRERARRSARRSGNAYRYTSARAAPRYYAYNAPRRGRSWMSNFFGLNP